MFPLSKAVCLLVVFLGVSLAFPTPHEGATDEKVSIVYYPGYEACVPEEDEEDATFDLIMCLMEQETGGAFRGLFPDEILEVENCSEEPSEVLKAIFMGARDAVEICIVMEKDPFPSEAMRKCIFSATLIQLSVLHENISPVFRVIFNTFYVCDVERDEEAHAMCMLTDIIFADHGFGSVVKMPENTPIYPVTLMTHELWVVMKDCVAEHKLSDPAALSYCASLKVIDGIAQRKTAISHHLAKLDKASMRY